MTDTNNVKTKVQKKLEKKEGLLSLAGIRGLDYYSEVFIYASILLGDPVCLIGRHGSAKSEVSKIIGQALNTYYRKLAADGKSTKVFNFHAYDTSKLSFDDLMGYPDPNAFKEGKVNFLPTKLTIWDKDLVTFEEINRAVPELQNSLLEIIRSRTCSGLPINTKFIFATMNPFGSVATSNMVEALVDRFIYYITFPDFNTLTDTDRKKIIMRLGDADSVGLRVWNNREEDLDFSETKINPTLLYIGESIYKVLSKASEHYNDLKEKYEDQIILLLNKIVDVLITKFKDHTEQVKEEVRLSGRRVGMIYRSILAARSVQLALYETLGFPLTSFESLLINSIKSSIPIGISGKVDTKNLAIALDIISNTVNTYWKTVCTNSEELDTLHKIFNSIDPFERLGLLMQKKDSLQPATYVSAWSEFITASVPVRIFIQELRKKIPEAVPEHMDVDAITKVTKDQYIKDKNIVSNVLAFSEEFAKKLEEINEDTNIDLLDNLFDCIILYSHENNNNNLLISLVDSYRTIKNILINKYNLAKKSTGLEFMDEINSVSNNNVV